MSKISEKIEAFVDEKILSENLDKVVSERFARYSKYIIQDRALPDARDGLKPVQRRILYAMHQMSLLSSKPHKKSARVAGEVMGKYHPHGDSSIYEAMVRMSQNFKMRVPLVDMHGNNGSIDGDTAAAMRYTEARLSPAAEILLKDIDKKTVPFIPNFDDEEMEPSVLPAKFPNLLVNGATGISAGYATKIPPHNLGEVIDATIFLIDNSEATIGDILEFIKGPDFPTGAIALGYEGIKQALETGAGKITLRARTTIEDAKGINRIVISEIPYEVNKSELVRVIDLFRVDKKLEDIIEVRDESDKEENLRIVIDLKKSADPQVILNYLFKNSDLQVSYVYNMVAILNHRPVLVGVIPIIKTYIEHERDIITNRCNFELEKASKRLHIVEGLIKMVSILTEVIDVIRNSNNKQNSKENLMERFLFSELQAEAIVTLQLYRLSSTDIRSLEEEENTLKKTIKNLEHVLSNEKALLNIIKNELREVKTLLETPRKTDIVHEVKNIKVDTRDLISDEAVYVGISKDGYVKRSSIRSYTSTPIPGLKALDYLIFEKEVKLVHTLLIFTNLGNYVFLPVYKIDDQKWKDLGIYINNIVPINSGETIVEVLLVDEFKDNIFVLLATKKGSMKQVALSDFLVTRYNKTFRAIKLTNDDYLASVSIHSLSNIVACTKRGYFLRFLTSDLPVYNTTAGGVKSVAVGADDALISARYTNPEDEIAILTTRGHIIKDTTAELPLYNRNRRGLLIVERLKNNPHLVAAMVRLSSMQVRDNVEVILAGTKASLKCFSNDMKYQATRFGKKMFEVSELGEGCFMYVYPSVNELYTPSEVKEEVLPIQPKMVIDSNDVIEEEQVTKDNQKIRISRLDLFDE